jgi:hypothetical protein
MSKINTKIKENFDTYKQLLSEKKVLNVKQISFDKQKSHKNWIENNSQLNGNHETKFLLNTQQSKLDRKDYKFRLVATDFCEQALARFDADGATHHNKDNQIPLSKRKIEAPHFHCFDKNGKEIAYKTTFLEIKDNCTELQKNISIGLNHFCNEFNIQPNQEKQTEIVSNNSIFPFDIHDGVNFI